MRLEHCHKCRRDTFTILQVLSSGHVGRLCVVCRTCRLGRPYASKREFQYQLQQAEGHRARGQNHDQPGS